MINLVKELLDKNYDAIQAEKMSAYMQNLFPFAGIPKPKLKEIIKPILTNTSREELDWDFVFELWNIDYREAQYIALEYLVKHRKQINTCDIDKLKELTVTKSWWETVDTIDAFVGELVQKDESLKSMMLEWASSDNIWLRRVAIDYQQEYKEKTDTEMLSKVILLNLNSKEFFINKAIGWSLRDYSKINPSWVSNFIENNKSQMAPLSIKEGSKYL